MKTACIALVLVFVVATPAPAGDTGAILGALLGAGAGLLVGKEVDEIHPAVAVPVLALAGGWVGRELDRKREAGHRPAPPAQPRDVVQPAEQVADLHPGVDLVKVSIRHSNGVRTDVPILRTGDKFVGPRGETYTALPSAELLRHKYGM